MELFKVTKGYTETRITLCSYDGKGKGLEAEVKDDGFLYGGIPRLFSQVVICL